MATFVLTNADFTINGTVQSDHVRQVTLEYNAEMLDETIMATAATRISRAGLFVWTMTAELYDDMADADVDDLLFALVGAPAFPLILKPTQASTSASNPSIRGQAVLEGNPVGGTVGEMAMKSLTFRSAGPLTRNDAD